MAPRRGVARSGVGDLAGRGGYVLLRVRIDAGPLFLARFDGNARYDADALTAALGLDTETDRSPPHLAEKIRTFYEKRGFLDAQVRAEVRGATMTRVQLLVFHIDEHRRARVVARRYPCLKLDAIKNLSAGGPRSSADIGTRDRQLPRGGAARRGSVRRPQSRRRERDDRRRRRARSPRAPRRRRSICIRTRPTSPDTYERAVEHVQELYRNEGFLHAEVGPVQRRPRALRSALARRTECSPLPLPPLPPEACAYDPSGLPLPAEPLDPSFTCHPDPARGVECAPTMRARHPGEAGAADAPLGHRVHRRARR